MNEDNYLEKLYGKEKEEPGDDIKEDDDDKSKKIRLRYYERVLPKIGTIVYIKRKQSKPIPIPKPKDGVCSRYNRDGVRKTSL